jgi:tetratricopeptide (TPR) repeat protein
MRAFNVLIALVIITILSAATTAVAQESIEKVLSIEDPQARITAIQKFIKTNNVQEQTQIAREALTATYAQLGDNELGNSNIEQANEEFRRATAALPEKITDRFFEDTVIRIPLALSVRGYRNEAIALARTLEKRFAKEPGRIARIGEFYMTIEAPTDAIRALEAASAETENATLHRALGSAYRMGLRLDDAVSEFQLAIKSDARDKRAYYEMANLYRAFGADADAIKLYQKQIEIDPKHTSSYKGMALALLSMGKDDDAAAALNQARDLRGSAEELTGDLSLQTQLAFRYLARGKIKLARQSADAALYLEPRYAWARIAAAEIDMAEGKYFDAERQMLAAKNYASFPTLFFTLGKIYLAVEDFDGAQEQFALAFNYSQQKQFTARLGGAVEVEAENLKDLLAPEHRAAVFLDQSPTLDEQFKIAESLVKFNTRLKLVKMPPPVNRPTRGQTKPATPAAKSQETPDGAQMRRKLLEDLDQAAMSFIEAENIRRSFRMLYIAQRLAKAGAALGLAVELADQALGLAEVAVEYEGSLRDYPNYDRNGRLSIFRGRALDAKGLALFKQNKNEEAAAVLTESVKAYGSLAESKGALWRLATVRESSGEIKEALNLYIAAYEPAANPGMDINRAVIESLYRKVNGSLEGLDKLIGADVIASNASFARPAPKPMTLKPVRAAAPKESVSAPSPSPSTATPTILPKTPAGKRFPPIPLNSLARRAAALRVIAKYGPPPAVSIEPPDAPPPADIVLKEATPTLESSTATTPAPEHSPTETVSKTKAPVVEPDPEPARPVEQPVAPPPPVETASKTAPVVVATPPADIDAKPVPPVTEPDPEPAPVSKKPIELPSLVDSAISMKPLRMSSLIPLSLISRRAPRSPDAEDLPPPTPPSADAPPLTTPSVHTRKRRVTTVDEQPPLR